MNKFLTFFFFCFVLLLHGCGSDACEKDCQNGGTCENGKCKCMQPYQGPGCSWQVTPSNIVVRKVEVLSFPTKDETGNNWDETGEADLSLAVQNESGHVVLQTSAAENAVAPYTFDNGFDLHATVKYTILLYDYDGDDVSELIGSVEAPIYSSTNGFPAILNYVSGEMSLRLTIEYQFN